MVRVKYLLLAALALLNDVQGLQMERSARRSKSWIEHKTLSGKRVDKEQIELTFAVKQQNKDKLHKTLLEVSTPSSPSYGNVLTLAEVNAMTSPSPEALKKVSMYMASFGVQDISYSSGFLRATVGIETAEKMLSTKYATYEHTATGEIAVRCEDYYLPDHIAEHVDFVSPTVNFPPQSVHTEVIKSYFSENTQNTPDNLRELYEVGDAMGHNLQSARQGVTAFLKQYYLESDLQTFYDEYFPELSGVPLSNVIGPNGDKAGVEASLDVEYMTTLGAGVPTEFWSFAGRQPDAPENEPFLDWLYLLGNTTNPPLVFSTSYGEDESSVTLDYAERMNEEFQKNSLRGISFLFASGDSGVGSMSGNCVEYEPMYPADSPYVTAVGATTKINPEEGASLSSGGFSYRWSRPSWQDAAVEGYLANADNLPNPELYNGAGRGFPDVSAQGTSYLVINNNMTLPGVAGTSASSPTFAGIISMLNDARISVGKSPMGFLNPFIYENPDIFNDVTSGNNPGCHTDGFYAASGWDPITGNGTPNYPKMLNAALALP